MTVVQTCLTLLAIVLIALAAAHAIQAALTDREPAQQEDVSLRRHGWKVAFVAVLWLLGQDMAYQDEVRADGERGATRYAAAQGAAR
ncbi:hypothetical protein RAN3_2503 [plant metagenome]|uniref:Uncharacterized protein n=1 Tax=plant metagenome TaxID=1297885 RepID=A0A484U251_9ZZZZ